MCGRFSITSDKEYLENRFKASFSENYNPRFNAAPNQKLPVVSSDRSNLITFKTWGMRPEWYKKMKGVGQGLINVRDDNLKNKRTFEKDLLNRRCLVLADGFYEWKKESNNKVPYRFEMVDRRPFALAGIWQSNVDKNGEGIETFAIITTEGNLDVEGIHNRMPVILDEDEESIWLGSDNKDELLSLLNPLDEGRLEYFEVSKDVNSPMNDNPEVMERVL